MQALAIVLALAAAGPGGIRTSGNPQPFFDIKFQTGEQDSPLAEGQCRWSADDATLECGSDVAGTAYQYGQEQLTKVVNKTGGTLADGTAVYINGAQGNRPSVAKADADVAVAAHCALGLLTNSIANNGEGYVTTAGLVRGLDTSLYAAGTRLYVSQTAGEWTATAPAHPAHAVIIGMVVVQHGTQGVILVKTRSGFETTELHDVDETEPATNGGLLVYDSTSGVYVHTNTTRDLNVNGSFRLTDTAWEDLRVPITAVRLGGAADPDFVQFRTDGAGSTGVYLYAFDAASDEQIYFDVQTPHAALVGADLDAHVHWSPGSSTNTGSVVWGLECTRGGIGSTFAVTTIYTADADPADGTAYKHQYHDISDIDMSGTTVSTVVICRLFRDANHASDTFTGDAFLLGVDFHYQVDSLGSDTELAKDE